MSEHCHCIHAVQKRACQHKGFCERIKELEDANKDKSQLLARYVAKNNALEAESEDWECLGQLNDILQAKIDELEAELATVRKDRHRSAVAMQKRIEKLEAELRNAEGYLWDASDASQWEDYINGVPHLKSEYTKENDDG